ncbi:MAG: hypothetical protein ACO3GH_01315, partial [Ilumatobacteraceae bacterium]
MTRRVFALVVAAVACVISSIGTGVMPARAVDEPPLLEERVFGTSVQGRPITAWHRGAEGG